MAQLIAGPKVFICNECVDICIDVLGANREWCDKQIGNIRRLRRQARAERPQPDPQEGELPSRHRSWLGWLWR